MLKRNSVSLIALGFLLGLSACSKFMEGADTSWLHGTWILSHNPDNDDEDKLVFTPDTVTVKTVSGQEIPGKYMVNEQRLYISLSANNKVIDIEFSISDDKTKLIYETGAFYTRQ